MCPSTNKKLSAVLAATLAFAASPVLGASISASAGNGVLPFAFVGESNFDLPTPPTRVSYDDILPFEPPSNMYQGEVSGYTDIETGEMGFFAEVTSDPDAPEIFGLDGGVIYGGNSIRDVLTFTPSNMDDYEITLTLAIEGEIDLNGAMGGVSALLRASPGGFQDRQSDNASYDLDGMVDDVLSVSLTLNGAAEVEVDAFLDFSFDSYPGNATVSTLDFSNTATLSLIVPDGVTYTSESEAFLTAPSAIPVPPAVALMLPALVALVFIRRPNALATA